MQANSRFGGGRSTFAPVGPRVRTDTARDMQAANGDIDVEVEMAESAKCAHPACECVVQQGGPYGKYCSEYCQRAAQQTELHCNCHHPGCR
jgi:hypothetical protein